MSVVLLTGVELPENAYWGRVKSCVFWGNRSGTLHKDRTLAFRIKKWNNGSQNSKTADKNNKTYRGRWERTEGQPTCQKKKK